MLLQHVLRPFSEKKLYAKFDDCRYHSLRDLDLSAWNESWKKTFTKLAECGIKVKERKKSNMPLSTYRKKLTVNFVSKDIMF